MSEPLEVTPLELKERLAHGEEIAIIDVREPEEHAMARIDSAILIPMQSIPPQLQRLEELADSQKLAILCHHGVRSLQVAAWLRQNGVEDCFSIAGGIDRWSREVDGSVARY